MNTLKLIAIPVTIIIAFTLLTFIIQWILKHFKAKTDENGKLKLAYAIWFASLFFSGSFIIANLMNVVIEVLDNVNKLKLENPILEVIKALAIILGLGLIWFLAWHLIVKILIKVVGKWNEEQEMNNNSCSYFIIRGSLLLGIVMSLSGLLSIILKMFVPSVEVIFYH